MLNLSQEFIDSLAPNQSAILNGWGLVKKNSFVKLCKSSDDTVLFGECKGGGANNYITSVDFLKSESPVSRCSCPSRQFPCKHALGLMYAFVSEKAFAEAEIPQDIMEKREKIEKKEEKKKEQSEPEVRKVNKNALAKKIRTQLEGLELLDKITQSVLLSGMGTLDKKTLDSIEEQAKQLGNYYLPGAQAALREFTLLFRENEKLENIYSEALDKLTRLYSIVKKGKEYLEKRLNDPEMPLEKESTIDEWLGHVWQLAELKALGLVEEESELIQISFNSYEDNAKMEFNDTGVWLNLKSGQIQETRNYRPFKAAKYIREDDTFFSAAKIKELYVYPGDMNPRIRWEEVALREVTSADFEKINAFSKKSFTEVIKLVKNQIKNPLAQKYPVALLKYSVIGKIENHYVMEDENKVRLVLEDHNLKFEPPSTHLLSLLKEPQLKDGVILVRFFHNLDSQRLRCQPLSIISSQEITRFIY